MSTICRLCLRNDEHIKKHNVFDLLLCDNLYWIFDVEIDALDNFSKWICQKCLNNVDFVLKLKRFFQMNQYFLKERKCPLDFDIEVVELKFDVGTQTEHTYSNDNVKLSLETLLALNRPVVELNKLEKSGIYKTYTKVSKNTYKKIQGRKNSGVNIKMGSVRKNQKNKSKIDLLSKQSKLKAPPIYPCPENDAVQLVSCSESISEEDICYSTNGNTNKETPSNTKLVENIKNVINMNLNQNSDSNTNINGWKSSKLPNQIVHIGNDEGTENELCISDQTQNNVTNNTNVPIISSNVGTSSELVNEQTIEKESLEHDVIGIETLDTMFKDNFQIKPSYVELTKLELPKDNKHILNNLHPSKMHSKNNRKVMKNNSSKYYKSFSNWYDETFKQMVLYQKHSVLKNRLQRRRWRKKSRMITTTLISDQDENKDEENAFKMETGEVRENKEEINTNKLGIQDVDRRTSESIEKELFLSVLKVARKEVPRTQSKLNTSNNGVKVTEKENNENVVDLLKATTKDRGGNTFERDVHMWNNIKTILSTYISEGTSGLEQQYNIIKRKLNK